MRSRRRRLAVAMSVVLVVGGLLVSGWFTPSTRVTREAAVDRFRVEQRDAEAVTASTTAPAPAVPSPGVAASGAGARGAVATTVTATSGSAPASVATGQRGREVPFRPARGVYTYRTIGGESLSGVPFRDFPSETYRTVVHTSADTWTDHHLFLEERQSWTSFARRPDGRVVASTRNLVRFRGVEVDETITFTPPMRSILLPWERTRRWEGTFSGETSGRYRGATVDQVVLRVAGAAITTWLDELDFELSGRVSGTVRVKRWTSPGHGVTVREEYDADVRRGPLTYSAKWSVHLLSLEPQS